jgi:hypothetical protein
MSSVDPSTPRDQGREGPELPRLRGRLPRRDWADRSRRWLWPGLAVQRTAQQCSGDDQYDARPGRSVPHQQQHDAEGNEGASQRQEEGGELPGGTLVRSLGGGDSLSGRPIGVPVGEADGEDEQPPRRPRSRLKTRVLTTSSNSHKVESGRHTPREMSVRTLRVRSQFPPTSCRCGGGPMEPAARRTARRVFDPFALGSHESPLTDLAHGPRRA